MVNAASQGRLPHIVVFGTGGTIAGTGEAGMATNYRPGSIGVSDLLGATPGLDGLARLSATQVCNVNSDDITGSIWLDLARQVNEAAQRPDVDGIVVTHGTDTLDETAYFLNLTARTDKPVVLTGAMRPATATSADGPMNLYQAVALACSSQARGRGVMAVLSDGIYGGRDVQKVSTFTASAFSSGDFGRMGYVLNGQPHFYNVSTKLHTSSAEFDVSGIAELPAVAVVYFSVDADPGVIDYHVQRGAKGIVVAGAGAGCYSRAFNDRIVSLAGSGIPVVRCSRIGSGLITYDDAYEGDLVLGNDLAPQKAAVLLRLALTKTADPAELQRMFDSY